MAYVEDFRCSAADASILLTEVEHPEPFGVARLNERGEVVQLVEKPNESPSKLALVGVCMFTPTYIVRWSISSPRGEMSLSSPMPFSGSSTAATK